MFKQAKIEDRVYSLTRGWGTISYIHRSGPYSIKVIFDSNITEVYTDTGYSNLADIVPSLFWDEVKFDIPKKPLPELEVDTKLTIWTHDKSHPKRRHFSHFDSQDRCCCFEAGQTSFTTKSTVACDNWELYKE